MSGIWEWYFLIGYLCYQEQVHKCLQCVIMSKWKVITDLCLLYISTIYYFSKDLPDSKGQSFFPVELTSSSQLLLVHAVQLRMLSILQVPKSFYPPTLYIPFCVTLPFQQKEKWHPEIKSSIPILSSLSCLLLLYPYPSVSSHYRLCLHRSFIHLF